MTATMEEGSSARTALLAYLSTANGPVSPGELASMTGINANAVRQALWRMSNAGEVVKGARGYELAHAQVAVREPDAVIPARPVETNGPAIDGAKLLDGIARYAGHFVKMPSRAGLDVLVIWAAMTHLRDEHGVLATDASPRLMFLSNEPGSGKSTALEVLAQLCHNADGLTVEPTEAAFRSVLSRETVLLDEADVLFGSGKRKESIRAAINAGYTRNGCVKIMDHRQVIKVNCFGALAIAGLDVLEKATGGLLQAILSRSIIIRMVKPPAGTDVPDITASAAGREAGVQGNKLLALWAAINRDAITSAEPEMPEGVRLRTAQIWRPLLQIADVAGGHWPERARAACTELATATPEMPAMPEPERDATGDFFEALDAMEDEEF